MCLCFRCHRYFWHLHPLDATAWFQRTYPERYAYLMARKNTVKKWTMGEMEAMLLSLTKSE